MATFAVIVLIALALLAVALLFLRSGKDAAPDVAVLSQLRQAGSDLSKPHDVEFFMYFPNEAAANAAAAKLQAEGFAVTVEASGNGRGNWLALATMSMVPTTDQILKLRRHLTAISTENQGVYDGWGAPVVT